MNKTIVMVCDPDEGGVGHRGKQANVRQIYYRHQ